MCHTCSDTGPLVRYLLNKEITGGYKIDLWSFSAAIFFFSFLLRRYTVVLRRVQHVRSTCTIISSPILSYGVTVFSDKLCIQYGNYNEGS
jgi:hypothetical protein